MLFGLLDLGTFDPKSATKLFEPLFTEASKALVNSWRWQFQEFGSLDSESVVLNFAFCKLLKRLVSAEGIESATKRSFNNMQGHG